MRWINAKERLPDTDECALVIASGKYKNIELVDAYALANYFSGCGWCLDAYPDMEDLSITWWMYLPDPPTVDPESLRPHGRWEKWNETWHMPQAKGYLRCSECKDVYIRWLMLMEGKWNFCPNCGAQMDKEMPESEVSE